MRRLYVGLLHHPVLDRGGEVVTTAITNLDLHDIARSAHTFGVARFFVAHPVAAQRELAERVRRHWVEGSGALRIPDRRPPMERLSVVESLEAALEAVGEPAEVWTTSAARAESLEHEAARGMLAGPGAPVMLCFGTGWGLAESVHECATRRLAPIESPRDDGYNHLSVRAAAAIFLHRLLGSR